MKRPSCCRVASLANPSCRPAIPSRRTTRSVGFLASSAVLFLMPKCPACVAAYVALATGLSISTRSASRLQSALVILCCAMLLFTVQRAIVRFLKPMRFAPTDKHGTAPDHGLLAGIPSSAPFQLTESLDTMQNFVKPIKTCGEANYIATDQK